MKFSPCAVFVGASIACTSTPLQESVHLVGEPRAGLALKREYVLEHKLTAQRVSTTTDGIEQNSSGRVDMATRFLLRVHDEVRAVADGRPTLLRRIFDEGQFHGDFAGQTKATFDGASPLAGVGVLFTWVPEEKGYGRLFDGLESSEEFLPPLTEDMDMRALLPGRDVQIGATWEAEPARMAAVFAPGGEVPLRFGKGSTHVMVRTLALGVGGPLWSVFGGEAKGSVHCKLESTSADESGAVAVIAVDCDLEMTRDQQKLFSDRLTPAELGQGLEVRASTVHWKLKGSGKLTWCLADGVPRSFTLSGAEEVGEHTELVHQNGSGPITTELVMTGLLKCTDTIEAKRKNPR